MTNAKSWGGPRKGSGRPKKVEDGTLLSALVTPKQMQALDAYAEDFGVNRSEALRMVLEDLAPSTR